MTDTCRNGHPRTPENTMTRNDPKRPRECRQCHRDRNARNAARSRNAAAVKAATAATAVRAAATLEDLTWMAETGETIEGAAARLGWRVSSVEAFLRRHNAQDVLHTFARLLPIGTAA